MNTYIVPITGIVATLVPIFYILRTAVTMLRERRLR
jgi:hypothetical protein